MMNIVMITPKDAALAAAQVAGLLSELAPGYDPDPTAMESVACELLETGAMIGFLAMSGDLCLGAILLNPCAAIYAGGRFGEITELYVRPDARSRGIAAALVARAVKHGNEAGWKRLEVGAPSQPEWSRTLAFYRREGFSEVGPRLRLLL